MTERKGFDYAISCKSQQAIPTSVPVSLVSLIRLNSHKNGITGISGERWREGSPLPRRRDGTNCERVRSLVRSLTLQARCRYSETRSPNPLELKWNGEVGIRQVCHSVAIKFRSARKRGRVTHPQQNQAHRNGVRPHGNRKHWLFRCWGVRDLWESCVALFVGSRGRRRAVLLYEF